MRIVPYREVSDRREAPNQLLVTSHLCEAPPPPLFGYNRILLFFEKRKLA